MRKIILVAGVAMVLYSCKTPRYIPIEATRIEYRDNFVHDSTFRYDSIFVKEKGDTLILERYRYLFRNKVVRDSISMQDTIRVPYPVEVVKQVKKPLSCWQNFQMWCGRIALIFALIILMYFVSKLRKNG